VIGYIFLLLYGAITLAVIIYIVQDYSKRESAISVICICLLAMVVWPIIAVIMIVLTIKYHLSHNVKIR
jgi:hypothetical protein